MKRKIFKIFIVEDDPIERYGFRSMIEEIGYTVVGEAANGKEAVEQVFSKNPDLIIMDIHLPLINGIEAIGIINKKKRIPCIIITGYRKQQFIEAVKNKGIFGYIQKPIDKDQLKSAIKIAISRFNEMDKLRKDVNDSKEALLERKYIERAKGILMDKFYFKEADAMRYLQKKARDNNRTLIDIAMEIIKTDNLINL